MTTMPTNDPRPNNAAAADPPALRDRVEAILAQIRPAIQMDGGDLELVDVRDDGVVVVRLHGACVGCPSSHITLQAGIERQLRDHVPEVRGVEALN